MHSFFIVDLGGFRQLNISESNKTIQWQVIALITVLFFLCFFFLFTPIFSQEKRYFGKTISRIEFSGLKNLEADRLYEVITSRYNKPFLESAINEDVHQLFNTGYFSNVIMRIRLLSDNTLVLNYEVTELPLIEEINYIGLEELSSQEFIQEIDLSDGDFFSLSKIKKATKVIATAYKKAGFFHAEVWYRIDKKNIKKNTLKVFFVIDEGKFIPIGKINILGLNRLNPDYILNFIEQKQSSTYTDSIFQKEKFEEDKYKILSYAKSQGLLNVQFDVEKTGYEIRWISPKQPEKGRVVVITYAIQEGEIKYFAGYSIAHDPKRINQEFNPPERPIKDKILPLHSPDILARYLNLSDENIGDFFDQSKYFRDRASMQEAYAQRGYVFTQIRPDIIDFTLDKDTIQNYEKCLLMKNVKTTQNKKCKKDAKRLNLTYLKKWIKKNPKESGRPMRHVHFYISENNLAHVEDIIIRGNEKTEEHVIRREILIREGQLFSSTLVNISRQNLINLRYFSEVNLQMRPGSNQGKMNIVFEVKEQPTGNISVGGTYGINTGFALNMKLTEDNFRGTSQTLSGSIDYGVNRKGISMSWNEPWFYEKCRFIDKSFWRTKQKIFDSATHLNQILLIARGLQNEHEKLGRTIYNYAEKFENDSSIKTLDKIKLQIRLLLSKRVLKEEVCYREHHTPWSLGIGASFNSQTVSILADSIHSSSSEVAQYQSDRYGVSLGTSHRITNKWLHYHSYVPSWSNVRNPSTLAPDILFLRARQNLQFQSSLQNGLRYSTIDNNFNPTHGFSQRLEAEIVGGLLGGQDHFNRYIFSSSHYFWWFDFTFGGLFKNRNLKRWRVVQETTFRATFTQETSPQYSSQNKELNPHIESRDLLNLGGPGQPGFGRLRGYNTDDSAYPRDWRFGAHHMILWGTELRVPLEPNFLWFAFFLDAGTLYNTVNDFIGEQKVRANNYSTQSILECAGFNTNINRHYSSCSEWNDPKRTELLKKNIALDRFLYSWGFGLRVQIPVLPLRIFYARKLYYAGNASLKPIPGDDNYEIVFGIGDFRF